MTDYMPKSEKEIRSVVNTAFPIPSKSWGDRTLDEQHAFRILGEEHGPYIIRMLLDILDKERANSCSAVKSSSDSGMNCWKQIVSGALQLACQAQRVSVIQTGKQVFDALLNNGADRQHILEILLPTAYEVLNLKDEQDYRRLLELLDHCNLPLHRAEIVTFGLASDNEEVVETAHDWF